MISQYGDIVSNSVVAILKHDPRRAIFITEKLVGQQLKILEFAAAVTHGKNELKLTDASITPVTHFIEIISLESKQSGIDTQHARELMSTNIKQKKRLYLEIISAKDISLKLAILSNIVWDFDKNFDAKSLRVEIQVYGAEEKIGTLDTWGII
ncbi:unnamed protein product [Rotaria socialis]|uniref:Uncharacterized protein n=1 Tax=Rotaria socialis TaxID=392032 RepID=A0A820S092_9BILA|nr:unnamed protein product [Rotaria socialis]